MQLTFRKEPLDLVCFRVGSAEPCCASSPVGLTKGKAKWDVVQGFVILGIEQEQPTSDLVWRDGVLQNIDDGLDTKPAL